MKLKQIERYLTASSVDGLTDLFTELGWDRASSQHSAPPRGAEQMRVIAQKRGYQVIVNPVDAMPDKAERTRIERDIYKTSPNKVVIFVAGAQRIWQFSTRDSQRKRSLREFHDPNERGLLAQFLARMEFGLDQEEQLTLVDVLQMLNPLAEVERVTKKFYDEFKKQHDVFMSFIDGIPDEQMQRWYASVMLNRLMFIYFLQKKQFVAGNVDYLKSNLEKYPQNYYQEFLCPLFFEGFAKKPHERATESKAKLGDVPYLNGGIFNQHQIEQLHGQTIMIADEAFQKIFTFFDGWTWHLDDRPLKANSNEINPDVLGYIFEKYINQRQMGAYYTKEDITEYICRSTIVPFLLDVIATDADWQLLADDPERYIFAAVRQVLELPLPPAIAAGITDVGKRGGWNAPADEAYKLPTEIWRETVARRQRAEQLIERMRAGEIRSSNQLITDNLDVRQFLQDVIARAEIGQVMMLWQRLQTLSVLDPTVGSGAFLFAALNILKPIYDACLDRMAVLRVDGQLAAHAEAVVTVLKDISTHKSQAYTVLKRIMINNLYGVDIMEEAVEICKLRLFLKLTAQISELQQLEPLPDIDFNIRAGNTLVGYARLADAQTTAENTNIDMDLYGTKSVLREKSKALAQIVATYRKQQSDMGSSYADKQAVTAQLADTAEALNQRLAALYGVDVRNRAAYTKWLKSHEPFHWCSEFYEIVEERGGFDVIVGNPPYVEYSKVKNDYKIIGYETESCGNLYANVIERCLSCATKSTMIGMIVQLPIICTDRMIPMQQKFLDENRALWFANFDDRPAKLFDGLEHIRATIFIVGTAVNTKYIQSTNYTRWHSEFRQYVFSLVNYGDIVSSIMKGSFPKRNNRIFIDVFDKLNNKKPVIAELITKNSACELYYHNAPQYWIRATDRVPFFWKENVGEQQSSHVKSVKLRSAEYLPVVSMLMNSSLFYCWFVSVSNCRDLSMREIENFPFGFSEMSRNTIAELNLIHSKLMNDYERTKIRKEVQFKVSGKVIFDEYYPRHSKHIIDEIDRVLAQHYGFSDEELDYIINYDIKYRMGLVGGAGEEEGEGA